MIDSIYCGFALVDIFFVFVLYFFDERVLLGSDVIEFYFDLLDGFNFGFELFGLLVSHGIIKMEFFIFFHGIYLFINEKE